MVCGMELSIGIVRQNLNIRLVIIISVNIETGACTLGTQQPCGESDRGVHEKLVGVDLCRRGIAVQSDSVKLKNSGAVWVCGIILDYGMSVGSPGMREVTYQ